MTKENERDATALRINKEMQVDSSCANMTTLQYIVEHSRRLYAEWQKASEPVPRKSTQWLSDALVAVAKTLNELGMDLSAAHVATASIHLRDSSPPAAPNAAQPEAKAGTPRTMQQLLDEVQDYTRWQLVQRMGQAERDRNTAERDLASATAKVAQWKAGGSMGTIAQWKLDAERYRWLQMEIARGDVKVGYFPYCLSKVQSPKEMNDAIDAAMLEAKEPK